MMKMVAPNRLITETEEDRLQRIDELVREMGTDYLDRFKAGSYGCHELMDRSLMFANMIEQHLLDHPACLQNAEWYSLIDQAVTALNELYQRVGQDHSEAPSETSTNGVA